MSGVQLLWTIGLVVNVVTYGIAPNPMSLMSGVLCAVMIPLTKGA